MSVHVMAHLWHTSPCKGSKLLLLLALADVADDDGSKSFLSRGSIAAKVRMSERQVIRLCNELVADGFLVYEGKSYRGTNEYSIPDVPPRGDKLSSPKRPRKSAGADIPDTGGDIQGIGGDKSGTGGDIAASPNTSLDSSSNSSSDTPRARGPERANDLPLGIETIKDEVERTLRLAHDLDAIPQIRRAARKQLEKWDIPFDEATPSPSPTSIEKAGAAVHAA